MRLDALAVLNVTLYALVASQHAFYAVGLERVQRSLRAPAYVELRNALDDVLRRSLPWLYPITLVVTVLSLAFHEGRAAAATALALAALLVEAWLMVRRSAPINARIKTWAPERPPADWESHRDAWLRIFHRRQLVVALGFLSLLFATLSH
jgi:TRAP-type uncharacterized transport system fused permease subunit